MKLITYLAPSIPADFFRLIARDLGATLEFNESISGPLDGDDEPFTSGRADVGFVCSPTYRWLRPRVELLPLPVPSDARSEGRPVYYAEIVVRSDLPVRSFDDLRGGVWAYNDRNSRSGWFSMLERVGESFFSKCIASGSHLQSIELVRQGVADAAAIDSNVLRLRSATDLRTLGSWGPFAIQPAIVRAGLEDQAKREIAHALLTMHERHDLEPFGFQRFAPPDENLYL